MHLLLAIGLIVGMTVGTGLVVIAGLLLLSRLESTLPRAPRLLPLGMKQTRQRDTGHDRAAAA